ncbi:glycosyltransferase family 9 protein, partial [Avibacterium avium]
KCGISLRKEKYDLVIDPTIILKNRDLLLLRLINAKSYFGYQKEDYAIFDLNLSQYKIHFSEIYKIALEKAGISVRNIQYDVPFRQKESDEIQKFLDENRLGNYIAINFYGAARIKKVTDENIPRYLSYLTKISPDKKFVLLSYPEVTQKLLELSKNYENIFVHNTENIFHTIELIKGCDQLISTDTSSVHIASGFAKPIIGIYKNDEESFNHWKPITDNLHILFYRENINEISPKEIDPDWLI